MTIRLPYNLAVPLLGIYPREKRRRVLAKTCMRKVVAAGFIIATKRRLAGGVDEQNAGQPSMGVLSADSETPKCAAVRMNLRNVNAE